MTTDTTEKEERIRETAHWLNALPQTPDGVTLPMPSKSSKLALEQLQAARRMLKAGVQTVRISESDPGIADLLRRALRDDERTRILINNDL